MVAAGIASAQKPTPLSNIFQDTQEVHVIDVDVVVTDADGRPIGQLTRQAVLEVLVGTGRAG